MNKKQIGSDELQILYKHIGYVMLVIILIYGLVIFCYDNFLSLFHWVNYRFLEKFIPSIFIPNLGNNNSYEKVVILGLMTLTTTIILPVYSFIYSLTTKIKYTKIFMVTRKDPSTILLEKMAGGANRTITLIEMSIIFPLVSITCLWIFSKTPFFVEKSLFGIWFYYFIYLGTLYVSGLYFALLIFKIFYQDILK